MPHVITQPAVDRSQLNDRLEIDRSAEDYLDWVENHQRLDSQARRRSKALLGVAFTLTAAAVAVMAFAGF